MKFLLVWCFLFVMYSMHSHAGEIALTFDDAPTPDSEIMDGKTRTAKLLRELRAVDVKEALFFVTTKHIDDTSAQRLQAYTKAGHVLGNHSHAHLSANDAAVDDFLLDAYRAHRTLKSFDNLLPLYRFPYLHYGKDSESRKAIAEGLDELGYSIGYVTVDNFDWYIDSLYRDLVKTGTNIDKEKFGRLYVETIWSTIEFYDELAKKSIGRSPKHVLLLHENDVAATYIGDLVRHIRAKGWKIITPTEAFSDPIVQYKGDFSFTKQGRVAALAHEAGVPIEKLRHPSESVDYLNKLFAQLKVADE